MWTESQLECRDRYESLLHQLANSQDRQCRMRARIARLQRVAHSSEARTLVARTVRLLAIEREHYQYLQARKRAMTSSLHPSLLAEVEQ